MYERAIDLVGPYCDLEKRLQDIPPAARVRGIWARNFENVLHREGHLERYLDIFGTRCSALGWHPCAEVITRIAVAGALHASPKELHAGMRAVAHLQASQFAESLLGRTLIRLLSPDPVRVLQQGAAARRQTCDYGRWEHDFTVPRQATVRMSEEYGWLESQVLGSAEGTLEAIGVPATFELRLTDAYNGTLTIRW